MVTRRGLALITGAVLAWLSGRALGVAELYAISVAAATTVGLGVLYVRLSTSSVAARRVVDQQRVVADARLEVAVELRNDSRLPAPTLLITEQLPRGIDAEGHPAAQARFVVEGLAPGKIAQATYEAHARVRGRYHLGPLLLRLRDPFGVAERVRRYTATHEVLVYPKIEPLPASPVRGAHMGAGSSDTRRVFATGEDFYTMREYVQGDDLRHIHWPSTAHRNTMMVRQMEQPWQAHATIYLDSRKAVHSEGADGTFEQAISVAASMVYHLTDANYMLRLVTDDTVGRTTPGSWESAMDRLAVMTASDHPGLGPSLAAARGGEGLFVAVLSVPGGSRDLARHPDLRALFGLRGFGQRLAFVVADDKTSKQAERMAGLLRGAGWSAATILTGQPLAPVWRELTGNKSRRRVDVG